MLCSCASSSVRRREASAFARAPSPARRGGLGRGEYLRKRIGRGCSKGLPLPTSPCEQGEERSARSSDDANQFQMEREQAEKPSRRLALDDAQLQSPPPALQAISLWLLSLWASKEKVTRTAAAVRKPAAGEPGHADAKIGRQRHWMIHFAHPYGAALRAFFALRARPAYAEALHNSEAGQ